MRIRYENTIDDVVAASLFHSRRSPTTRRIKAVVTWGIPVWGLILGSAFLFLWSDPVPLVVVSLFSLFWLFFYPRRFDRNIERQARRLMSEGKNNGTIGPHELELTDAGLVERNPFGESSASLAVVERVVSEGDYSFIYVSALAAHVIPHRRVLEGDPIEFVEALNRELRKPPTVFAVGANR